MDSRDSNIMFFSVDFSIADVLEFVKLRSETASVKCARKRAFTSKSPEP